MQRDCYKMDDDNKQSDLEDDRHIEIEKWMEEVEKGQQAQKNISMWMKEVEKGQRAQIKILKYLLKRDRSHGHWVPQSDPSVTFHGGTAEGKPEGTPNTGDVDIGLFINERFSPIGETQSTNQNLGVLTTERAASSRKSLPPNRSFTSPTAGKRSANLQKRILSFNRRKSNPVEDVKHDVSPPSSRLDAESRVGEYTNYFSDCPPQETNLMGRLTDASTSESPLFPDKESSSDSKQPWQKQLAAIEIDPLKVD